jgi:hypothetical protein
MGSTPKIYIVPVLAKKTPPKSKIKMFTLDFLK